MWDTRECLLGKEWIKKPKIKFHINKIHATNANVLEHRMLVNKRFILAQTDKNQTQVDELPTLVDNIGTRLR